MLTLAAPSVLPRPCAALARLCAPQHHVDDAIKYAKGETSDVEKQVELVCDRLAVNFGCEILKNIPGRVSTEVDAKLSFDTDASVAKAREIIALYKAAGVDKERILIKLASTWEGIRAAEILEKEGIHCNLTLLFSLVQAAACAEANVTLISPFVGRILDWFKKAEGVDGYAPADDPGVKSVTNIFYYYKQHGYKTQIMGASFRNVEEILELAGCDLLTIAPKFLEVLEKSTDDVPQKLDAAKAAEHPIAKLDVSETSFRWLLNESAMATEKLSEGIRNFNKDRNTLEDKIKKML